MIRLFATLPVTLVLILPVHAASPSEILATYVAGASVSPSANRGETFFNAKRLHSRGEHISCASCHTSNPKATGKTRANKSIEPIAPVANAERFTDPAKVEKWFQRNCNDVLERACTNQEKADFIAYMILVR